MTANRRRSPRSRVFQPASVVFNGDQSMFACTVRNLSETGAMLRMSDWIALPGVFEVDVRGEGGRRRVRQRWQRGDDVGVAFLAQPEASPGDVVSLDEARSRLRRPGTR